MNMTLVGRLDLPRSVALSSHLIIANIATGCRLSEIVRDAYTKFTELDTYKNKYELHLANCDYIF